jgi:glycosyltransferase involved in cell wall biosynthesis
VLQCVCQQTLDGSEYEVIVVDNNSTDETATLSHLFAARYPNVRPCLETQQGISRARDRGWREARGEYVAYIDDDCCDVPAEWLAIAKEVIAHVSPTVFGGPYFALYKTAKPPWYKDRYASYEPYAQAQRLERADALCSGNLFLRGDLFERIGGFNPDLGPVGQKLGYGEETELLNRIHLMMPQAVIYYEPRLLLYHLVRPEKMTWPWIIDSYIARGRDSFFISPPPKSKLRLLGRVVKYSLLLLFSLPFGLLFRNRKQYPYFQNFLLEVTCDYLATLGELYEQSRQLILH